MQRQQLKNDGFDRMNKIAGFVENLPQLSQHFCNTEVFGCQRKAAEDSRQKLAQNSIAHCLAKRLAAVFCRFNHDMITRDAIVEIMTFPQTLPRRPELFVVGFCGRRLFNG
jgi:hypothetical protein